MSKFTIAVAILFMLGIGVFGDSDSLDSDGYRRRRARRRNSGTPAPTSSSTICDSATAYGFCVSQSSWQLSYDGGSTYTEMYYPTADGWSSLTTFTMGPITTDTILKVNCTHTGPRMLDDNGLFIASVNCEDVGGDEYYTTDPLSDSTWTLTGSTDGDTDVSIYCPKVGTTDQNPCLAYDITDLHDEEINSNAYWVWNSGMENTLTFTLNFATVSNAMEHSASEMHSVVDVVRKENPLRQGSVVVLAGAGVLMTMILVAMFCGYRPPQKEEYQPLV